MGQDSNEPPFCSCSSLRSQTKAHLIWIHLQPAASSCPRQRIRGPPPPPPPPSPESVCKLSPPGEEWNPEEALKVSQEIQVNRRHPISILLSSHVSEVVQKSFSPSLPLSCLPLSLSLKPVCQRYQFLSSYQTREPFETLSLSLSLCLSLSPSLPLSPQSASEEPGYLPPSLCMTSLQVSL